MKFVCISSWSLPFTFTVQSDHINYIWRGSIKLQSKKSDHIASFCINQLDQWRQQRRQRLYEPRHDKTNKVACASRKDSDQLGHAPSLIRVFAVRMKKAWILSFPLSAQRRLGGYPGWSESSLGAHALVLVLSWFGSFLHVSYLILLDLTICVWWTEVWMSDNANFRARFISKCLSNIFHFHPFSAIKNEKFKLTIK